MFYFVLEVIELMSRLEQAREFCEKVRELADVYQLSFFVVTDGASATSNHGCDAVKNARDCHKKWEENHGYDPMMDWSSLEKYERKS